MEAFNQRQPYRLSPSALRLFGEVYRTTTDAAGRALITYILGLSDLFTRARGEIGTRYLDDPALLGGYAAYFLPVNFAKVQLLLNELPEDWAKKTTLSVLDVGAGPGTASLAVRDWLAGKACANQAMLRVTAVDHSTSALTEAARLWTVYRQITGVEQAALLTSVERIEKLAASDGGRTVSAQAPFDLIILANCLNELFHEASDAAAQRAALLERLLSVLKPDGTLIILEPALRVTARALHQTRDLVLSRGLCTVYSPCLHDHPCPALVKADDWCHEERSWDPPAWIAELDREVGFIKDALKFSYLLLRKDGRTIVSRRPDVYRVVSELRVFKGEKRAWLCNEMGRSEMGRLDRKASDSNADFEAWHRGAIVQIDRIVRKDRGGRPSELGRIAEDSAVQIVRGA